MDDNQNKWHVWVDGLPEDRADKHLASLQREHGDGYEFRIIDSPFHGGKAIEGRSLFVPKKRTPTIVPPD